MKNDYMKIIIATIIITVITLTIIFMTTIIKISMKTTIQMMIQIIIFYM